MRKNPFTPKELRELADRARVGQFDGWSGTMFDLDFDVDKALRWAAKEIEALRKRLSWMFVMNRRKKGGPSGPQIP